MVIMVIYTDYSYADLKPAIIGNIFLSFKLSI